MPGRGEVNRKGPEMPERAMILAAGLGKRMRPITNETPKPLVKVAGRTLLDWSLDRFAEAGVRSVAVNTHHLGGKIKDHLRERASPEIRISPEDELLETGGGVVKALPLLGDGPFFAANADMLWLNGSANTLERMAQAWNEDGMDILMLLHFTVDAYGYNGRGDYRMDPLGRISRRPERQVTPYLFTGLQIIHPRLFRDAPKGPFSLRLLYGKALDERRLHGIVHDGEWFHIGTPEGLFEAENYMKMRYAGIKRR